MHGKNYCFPGGNALGKISYPVSQFILALAFGVDVPHMTALTRRKLLTRIGAATIASPAVTFGYRASAALPPLPNLPARDGLLLRPGDAQFARVQKAFNARTMLIPQLRALCKNGRAAGVMVDWCRSNKLAFAVRCGGHSYEGFSQSASVVIDTRMINSVAIDRANKTATVGAGASLGELYLAIASHGFTFRAEAARLSAYPATCSAGGMDISPVHLVSRAITCCPST